MRLPIFILLLTVFLGVRCVKAETLHKEIQVDLDPVGDGTVVEKERYPAHAWLVWKRNTGEHPDLVVRDKRREYAAWEFYDFSFSEDEVTRTSESKMKVRALAQILNDGNYTLDKLISGLHLVTNNGNEWIFSGNTGINSSQSNEEEQTVHINLPAGAFQAHIVSPDSSQTELVYSVPRPTSKSSRTKVHTRRWYWVTDSRLRITADVLNEQRRDLEYQGDLLRVALQPGLQGKES